MKKYLSFLLIAVILLSLSRFTTYAHEDSFLIGDADLDGDVTIVDVTAIQRNLVSLLSFIRLQEFLSDVDGSSDTDIVDATMIQRKLLGISDRFYRTVLYTWKAELLSVKSADHPYNKATVGSTVEFNVTEVSRELQSELEVYIDGVIIKERGLYDRFSVTFDRAGDYNISVIAYDPFGTQDVYSYVFSVISAEPPRITSVKYNKANSTVSVTASGGTSPYEYSYAVRNNIEPPAPGNEYVNAEFNFKFDDDGSCYLYCDFCEEASVTIPTYMLAKTLSYYCEVQVRDSSGRLSDIKKVQIIL